MGPRIPIRTCLNNMVSLIDHIVMNHQNYTWTLGNEAMFATLGQYYFLWVIEIFDAAGLDFSHCCHLWQVSFTILKHTVSLGFPRASGPILHLQGWHEQDYLYWSRFHYHHGERQHGCHKFFFCGLIFVFVSCSHFTGFFLRITQYIGDTHNARTLIPMNTRTQTLPLGASSKTVPANPQDWRSHHRHLAVDGNVAYQWKHKRR
jgi:hypothetical protein